METYLILKPMPEFVSEYIKKDWNFIIILLIGLIFFFEKDSKLTIGGIFFLYLCFWTFIEYLKTKKFWILIGSISNLIVGIVALFLSKSKNLDLLVLIMLTGVLILVASFYLYNKGKIIERIAIPLISIYVLFTALTTSKALLNYVVDNGITNWISYFGILEIISITLISFAILFKSLFILIKRQEENHYLFFALAITSLILIVGFFILTNPIIRKENQIWIMSSILSGAFLSSLASMAALKQILEKKKKQNN